MKRGFLNSRSISAKSDSKSVISSLPKKTPIVQIPTGRVVKPDKDPRMGDFPLATDSGKPIENLVFTSFPPDRSRPFEPKTLTLLFPGDKEKIIALGDFFSPCPLPPIPSPFTLGDVPGAGVGMLAVKDINPGDLILSERPLLAIPAAMPYYRNGIHPDEIIKALIDKMGDAERNVFYGLHNCKGTTESHIRGIVDTNALYASALPAGYNGAYVVICYQLSRANHSCTPNAYHYWDLVSFTYQVRALRPIPAGEQILITYLSSVLQTRAKRQSELLSKYSFVCACPSCALDTKESKRSDIRRSLLAREDAKVDTNDESGLQAWVGDLSLPDDHVIKQSMKILDIMGEEQLFCDNIWPAHYQRICKAYCALSDSEKATEWAKKAAVMTTVFTGSEGGWRAVAASPQNTRWWGLRAQARK